MNFYMNRKGETWEMIGRNPGEECFFNAILTDKGKVSMLEARLKAEEEFDRFRVTQDRDYLSDFDREVKRITGRKKSGG